MGEPHRGRPEKTFASTDGALTQQTIYRASPNMNITAVSADNSDFETRQTTEVAPKGLDAAGEGARAAQVRLRAHEHPRRPLARLAPEDPEAMPELGPQEYRETPAWSDTTASPDPAARAQAVRAVTQAAEAAGRTATGYLETGANSFAVANSKGLFAYRRSTGSSMTPTVRTPDGTGSGWAGASNNDWSRIDPAALGRTAIEKARLSVNPVAIEPGRHTVVLEPTAVGNLVQLVAGAFDARAAIGALLALGVLSTAVAYVLYFWLLERVGPTRTTTVTSGSAPPSRRRGWRRTPRPAGSRRRWRGRRPGSGRWRRGPRRAPSARPPARRRGGIGAGARVGRLVVAGATHMVRSTPWPAPSRALAATRRGRPA